jgi:hypothetical protein
MIEKIALPFHPEPGGDKSLPVLHRVLHAGVVRKGNDSVKVIGHQQSETAMPDQIAVIVRKSGEYPAATVCSTELILSRRQAFNGYEKPASVGHPLWGGVRQFFANGQIHKTTMAESPDETRQ